MKVTTKTIITRHSRVEITGDMLRKALNLPAYAQIHFPVPTSGDWSGVNIVIDEDFPIVADWSTHEESEDESE